MAAMARMGDLQRAVLEQRARTSNSGASRGSAIDVGDAGGDPLQRDIQAKAAVGAIDKAAESAAASNP